MPYRGDKKEIRLRAYATNGRLPALPTANETYHTACKSAREA